MIELPEQGVTSDEEFEAIVARVLDEVPQSVWEQVDNLAFFIEDEPPDATPDLLGVYDGIPLTDRCDYGGILPDRIVIYRGPTLRRCDSDDEVYQELTVTVRHEIAHYFGIDDDQLRDWGWA